MALPLIAAILALLIAVDGGDGDALIRSDERCG
jgi:hypothetical protein